MEFASPALSITGLTGQQSDTTTPVVVIGAGPAGLATAAALQRVGVQSLILEQAEAIAARWRSHYDRLRLHTMREHSGLPFYPMPSTYPRYPTRDQVVRYLEEYAYRFGLRPHFGCRVRKVSRQHDAWCVSVDGQSLTASDVVVASGYNCVPYRPELPGLNCFAGEVLHTIDYRNPVPFRGKRVLVVGCGNSGGEVALDLCEGGAKVALVVRGPTWVLPRDILGIPSQWSTLALLRLPLPLADTIATTLLRIVVGDLHRFGIQRPRRGPYSMILEDGRIPLLDVGTLARIKSGAIRIRPAVAGFDGLRTRFKDGSEEPFDVLILATGFRTGLDELFDGDVLQGVRRQPRAFGSEVSPGLYFVGFRNPPTGALREIALEACRVATAIASRARRIR